MNRGPKKKLIVQKNTFFQKKKIQKIKCYFIGWWIVYNKIYNN